MLTIVHGSDTAQSRKFFLDEKNKIKDAVLWEAEQVNLTDLAQLFEGGGLFGETKHLFIEQLLTKRKKSSDLKEILKYLEKFSGENTIMIWEGKELERGMLNSLKNATVRPFKLPQTLFQFLDALTPGNSKTLIKLFHETISVSETEMVFFMLVRQVRMLLALSNQSSLRGHSNNYANEAIDELKRMTPWQKSKLEKQAHTFKPEQLLKLYDNLFKLEVGQKTGGLTSPLTSTIDFLLLEV